MFSVICHPYYILLTMCLAINQIMAWFEISVGMVIKWNTRLGKVEG